MLGPAGDVFRVPRWKAAAVGGLGTATGDGGLLEDTIPERLIAGRVTQVLGRHGTALPSGSDGLIRRLGVGRLESPGSGIRSQLQRQSSTARQPCSRAQSKERRMPWPLTRASARLLRVPSAGRGCCLVPVCLALTVTSLSAGPTGGGCLFLRGEEGFWFVGIPCLCMLLQPSLVFPPPGYAACVSLGLASYGIVGVQQREAQRGQAERALLVSNCQLLARSSSTV